MFLRTGRLRLIDLGKMDNLSSSELDTPSKTPLFIAIAAILVALVSLWLGWMGLSRSAEMETRAAALEAEIERLVELASTETGLGDTVEGNSSRIDKLSSSVKGFSENVDKAIRGLRSENAKTRSDLQKVATDALTAKKMVKELEEKGIEVAVVPGSSSSGKTGSSQASTRSAPDAAPGKSGVYTIKSGDTLGKIAAAYKITLSQLQAANPGIDPRRLRIGQQIRVPAPSN